MGLPERITKGCEVKGISKAELSRLIGVKPQQITEISQQTRPSKHLRSIAEIFGVHVEWLTTGTGPAPSWWTLADSITANQETPVNLSGDLLGRPSLSEPDHTPDPMAEILKKLEKLDDIAQFMETIKKHLGIADEGARAMAEDRTRMAGGGFHGFRCLLHGGRMLIIGLILLAIGTWGFLWGGKLWRRHYWQPWFDLAIIGCLILGFVLTLFAPKGEGGSRAVYFEPDAASPL